MPGRRSVLRFGFALSLGIAALSAIPGAAAADQCSIDSNTPLFDSGGYKWDIALVDSPTSLREFTGFNDGGSNGPADNPPGPRSIDDSYDQWGGLYVGSPATDAPESTLYTSLDDNSCTRDLAGRQILFPRLTVNGLIVQRKIFVPASGLQSARILDLVTNPGAAPVTTSVQNGGFHASVPFDGDLGSDGNTAVRSSSNGDLALTASDLWAVSSDHLLAGGAQNEDLALAHVMDGSGGLQRVSLALLGNPVTAGEEDELTYRWDGVTILPGQTAVFMSFEAQRGVTGADAAAEDAAAAAAAQALENAAPKHATAASRAAADASPLYSGMSAREVGSLRNWPTGISCFGRAPTIVGDDPTNDVLTGTSGADVIVSFGGNDKINGGKGKDRICAGSGNDKLKGGPGNDKLNGGPGKDKLTGGKGTDSCSGAGGKDKAAACEKLKKIP
jgi:hemolysin type calcium-binding protein